MVLMNTGGQNVADISYSLRRNPHTVRDWLKCYKAVGLPVLSRWRDLCKTLPFEVCAYLPTFCVPDERDLRFASTG